MTYLLEVEPDWSSNVIERLQWKTDIIQSRSGKEQRVKLRHHPKVTLEYDFLLYKESLRKGNSNFMGAQGSPWDIPLWQHAQLLVSPVTTAENTLTGISGSSYGIQPGDRMVIYGGPGQYEIITVAAVGATFVQATTAFQFAWSSGTRVIPIQSGYISSTFRTNAITSEATQGTIQVELLDYKAKPFTTVKTLNGKTVFNVEPNRVTPMGQTFNRKIAQIDFDLGPRTSYDLHGFSEITKEFDFISLRRDNGNELRKLVEECKGRWKSFYLPTHNNDIQLIGGSVSAVQTYLNIQHINYHLNIFPRFPNQYIRLELNDGSVFTLQVVGAMEVDAATEQLTLAAATGQNFLASEVKMISYLDLCRFDSDSIEFSWTTTGTVNATTGMVKVLQ